MPEFPSSTGRRSGRRHGKPPTRGLRSRLLRVALLPPLGVSLLGGGAVSALLADASRPLTAGAIGLAGGGTVAVLVLAARSAGRTARAIQREAVASEQALREQVQHLSLRLAEGQASLQRIVLQIRRGERPEPRTGHADGGILPGAGELAVLDRELREFLNVAESAVIEASARQQIAVFVNIARRLQSLVTRALTQLDGLEREVEDPELLEGLFLLDHLVTRVRRQVESLGVLGGAVPRRISKPVSVYTVLRQAVAEVEQYARVKVHQPIEGILHGHATADVIHLIAELVENAATFSPPTTTVHLRAERVAAGLAIEIDDRGLVMPAELRARMNELLTAPDHFDIGEQLKDGRIGLFVVAQLSRRHGITVRLQSNVYGGNQAVVVLPGSVLSGPDREQTQVPAKAPVPAAPAASGRTPQREPAGTPSQGVPVTTGVGAGQAASYGYGGRERNDTAEFPAVTAGPGEGAAGSGYPAQPGDPRVPALPGGATRPSGQAASAEPAGHAGQPGQTGQSRYPGAAGEGRAAAPAVAAVPAVPVVSGGYGGEGGGRGHGYGNQSTQETQETQDTQVTQTIPAVPAVPATPARAGEAGQRAAASPGLPLRERARGTAVPDRATADEQAGRPPLPRRSGSYLSPEFYENATGRDEPDAAPDPGLMARFVAGFARADDGTPHELTEQHHPQGGHRS